MTKRMLIDASHPEETRVVVLSGNRVEEFDYEAQDKKPLKGNIYLAKVTRVEPSLQAAFVDYGGNRNGFLPFSEIHPDYYRLPVADREALIQQEQAAQGDDDPDGESDGEQSDEPDAESEAAAAGARLRSGDGGDGAAEDPEVEQVETASSVETIAGDEIEDAARRRAAALGNYKIQEVIKRRQVILVQVVKEERGNKGAALTTYLSLAGRYCVLMPNTNKGGGISRKIANAKDRRRLKEVLSQLNIPEGMAVIVRTAGSNRTKAEIKRDYEYLLRLWDEIRETTLQSTAPCLIHEEANLIKRSIRDLYTRDMDEVLVEGESGYKLAKAFMRSLMPSHAKKVQRYDDPKVPLFQHQQVEAQLDNIHNPTVQLKSGGYIVMNQTEALVAIDVNSGKATKERHIEETALKTNLEAADEVARQLKLRDLAGLIVIDFIDMDNPKNNKEVEQRLKDAMKQDRARIQLGRISPFGLLELSRQRLRPSLHETSTEVCRTCGGSGFVRSPESTALHVLRALEEEGVRRGGGEIVLTVPTPVALYTLNEKRARLNEIESRYRFQIRLDTDDSLIPPAYRLDRLSTLSREEEAETAEPSAEAPARPAEAEAPKEAADEEAAGRKRGKRGGRRKKKEAEPAQPAAEAAPAEAGAETAAGGEARAVEAEAAASAEESEEEKKARRRRRGKRGGRRRSKRREEVTAGEAETAEAGETTEAVPALAEPAAAEPPGESEASEAAAGAEHAAAEPPGESAPAPAEAPAEPAQGRESEPGTTAAEAPSEDSGEEALAAEATAEKPAARATARRKTKTTTAKTSRAKSAKGKTAKAGAAKKESAESEAPAAETAEAETAKPEGEKTATPAAAETADETEAEQPESVLAAAAAESTGAGRGTRERGRGRTGTARTTSGGRSRRATISRGKRTASSEPATEAAEGAAPTSAEQAETEPAAVTAEAESEARPDQPEAPAAGEATQSAVSPAAPEAEAPESVAVQSRDVEPEPAATGVNGGEAEVGEEAPFGEAAEPQGSDDLAEQQERTEKPRRRGWWQKLLQ